MDSKNKVLNAKKLSGEKQKGNFSGKKVKNNQNNIFDKFCNGKFATRSYEVLFEKGVLYFLLSFFIPIVIMGYAFGHYNIAPFGEKTNQMLVVDLWHQYFPFFRQVREKLLTGGSFLYSWQNGLGSNFLSLISYYAASPLNLLSVFFDKDHVREAMTLILLAKIGFAGAFFSCFLRYTYNRKDLSICVFSVMYALSSYTLGYYWNVMWFDTIALFPLVMLGVVAICREGKWKTYTFALALSLISNYYVGYFTCIFTMFMFASAGIIEFRGVKKWLYSFWLIVRSSILAIGLGGFILLPAYYGLQLTYSADNTFPKDTVWYEEWKNIFANTISYQTPTKVEGLPNFACGMLAILLLGVFLFSRGIKIREKVSSSAMLAIIAVSCNMNKLNFIWHGFHFTNQIPYRFAFIFSFILAAAAFRAYDVMLKNGIRIYHFVLMLMGPFAVTWMNYLVQGENFKIEGALKSSLIIAGAFWMIFLAAKIFPFPHPIVRRGFVNIALAAAVFSEFSSNAQLGVKEVSYTGYKDYPAQYAQVESLLNYVSNKDKDPFYRTEMAYTYTLNDSALYGYTGLSQFSSAANVSVTTLCRRLGLYASEAGNRYYYRTSTPVVNTLFGIRYIIKRNDLLSSEDAFFNETESADTTFLYESKYPVSLGFMMNEEILDIKDTSGLNPFEYQNDIIRLATGIEDPVFVAQPVTLAQYYSLEVTKNGYGNYTFRIPDERTGESSVVYSFAGMDDATLYGYANAIGSCCKSINIDWQEDADLEGNFTATHRVDGGDLLKSYPLVFPMGNSRDGDLSKVTFFPAEDRTSGNFKLMIYALKHDIFQKAYDKFHSEELKISSFDDTKIKGTVNAKKDGILYLAMPYEKGWNVYVDGKKAESVEVLNAMMGVRVSAGEHDIELRYIPEGFTEGTAATIICVLLIVAIIWFEDRRKKMKAAAIAEAHEEEPEDAPAEDATANFNHDNKIYDQGEDNAPPTDSETENDLSTPADVQEDKNEES